MASRPEPVRLGACSWRSSVSLCAPASPLFQLGETVATPGALAVLQKHGVVPITLLRRHQRGDWGDLTAHDRTANDMAVKDGSRILSAYVVAEDKVWVVTEATTDGGNRQSTCILLSREYW